MKDNIKIILLTIIVILLCVLVNNNWDNSIAECVKNNHGYSEQTCKYLLMR